MTQPRRNVTFSHQETAILFFGLAIPAEKPVSKEIYKEFVDLGLASGYLPHPACCTSVVRNFLESQATNPNSTFWKTWLDVIDRSQEELFLHAIVHYLTTYGSGYTMPAYVPNEEYVSLPFGELKPILPASELEIAGKCLETLQSGIALSQENVEMMIDFIVTAVFNDGFEFDIDSIKNREAKTTLQIELRLLPSNPVELLRLITIQLTRSTLLIKSNHEIKKIAAEAPGGDDIVGALHTLDQRQLRSLASVFYRFKPIFLALRTNPKWKPIVNRIRRMARIFHKPMKTGVMESLLDPSHTEDEFHQAIAAETNLWKLFRAWGYLSEEVYLSNQKDIFKAFYIRNGKVHIEDYENKFDDKSKERSRMAVHRLNIIFARIKEIMSVYRECSGKKSVFLPRDINLVVPESEKQFIGDIPFGSYFDLCENNYFGVYWRGEWGTDDYDLSFISLGGKLGWNTSYKNSGNTVVFSGDMTEAEPEATEMFYCKSEMPNGIFKLNRFNGHPGSKARIFFGQEKIEHLTRNYMVDPSTIRFKADIAPEAMESIVGGSFAKRMYLFSGETGNSRVSSSAVGLFCMLRRISLKLSIEKLLRKSGYEILSWDDVAVPTPGELLAEQEDAEPVADFDFRNFTKDQIIAFFSDAMKAVLEVSMSSSL